MPRGESECSRQSDNVHNVNCLDVTLVRGGYLLGSPRGLDGRTTVTHDARSARSSVRVSFFSSKSGVCM